MTDACTDELFSTQHERVERVVYPVSRLVLDPERFTDDEKEPMAARGMGVIYQKTSQGRPLRRQLTSNERSALIERFYDPHHERLNESCKRALKAEGRCLMVDCHSFPNTPLPCDLDQAVPRPDFCIGTDPYHTPKALRELVVQSIRTMGYSVDLNRPYSGSLVPSEFYLKDQRVISIMIEVNRILYLDEAAGTKSGSFNRVKSLIDSVLISLRDIEFGSGGPLFHSLDEVEPMISNLKVVKSRSA